MLNNHKPYITEQAYVLFSELQQLGVNAILEYDDGYKHVDIAILEAHIYIEVDGLHHFTDPKQIEDDFHRSYYSDRDGFNTIHVPNIIIKKYCLDVANAINEIVIKRCG